MNNIDIVLTSTQVSYISEIIDTMGDRCDPYLSLIIRRTFENNSRKLQSPDIQDAIADIVQESSLDD